MLAGLISFDKMQVNNAPDIDFPAAIVSVSQPGAAPNELETQVTQRVESAVRGVNGVDEISSTVVEGNSTTFVTFQLGTPTDRAVNDTRNAIAQIRGNLPEGILEPQVTRVDAEDEPITYVGAQTTDMTLEQLSWYIDNTVAKRLLGQQGIAAVSRVGGVDRTIRVILDPAALEAQGITASQVNQQLRQSNMNGAGGRAEIAGSEQSVRVIGNAQDAYQLSQTQIGLPGGRFVRLADLGEIKDSNSEQRSLAKMNGRQVVTFMVQRAKGSSEVTAYEAAWKEIKKLEAENPKVHFSEIYNTVDYTKAQYRSAMEGLVEGAILAVLVVLLFLRDIRATAISAIAIPLSAIPGFWLMSLMGITLNFMSTMAMGLVAGVLVDDAIVEIENIVRHMRMGKSAYQAAVDAADEIGLAVLATTMAIVAVFFPVALMPGVPGQYFKAFAIHRRPVRDDEPLRRTHDHSLDRSLFPPLAWRAAARCVEVDGSLSEGPQLEPRYKQSRSASRKAPAPRLEVRLLCTFWFASRACGHRLRGRPCWGNDGPGQNRSAWRIQLRDRLSRRRGPCLWLCKARRVAHPASRSGTICQVAWHSRGALERSDARSPPGHGRRGNCNPAAQRDSVRDPVDVLFPPQNSDYSRVNITLPPGTTLKQSETVTDRVAAVLLRDPTVERVFERIGVGSGHVNIVLKKTRKVTSTEFERNLAPTLAAIADARVSFQSQHGGGPDADSRDIMLYLGGDDPVQLTNVANAIAKQMDGVPGLRAPRVGSQLAQPEITIKPRFDLAADLGVTTSALSQTIRIATLGDIEQNSAKFSLSDRQIPITVSLSENARRDLSTLQNLGSTARGGSVPLKAVAEIGFGSGPTTIQRSNQLRRVAIGADLASGVVEGDVWAKINELPALKNLPQGIQKIESRRPEVAVGAAIQLRHRSHLGRASGLCRSRPPLSAVPGAVCEHGLTDPCALGSCSCASHRGTADLTVRTDRHSDAVRDRGKELDPARRLRGRNDEPRHDEE